MCMILHLSTLNNICKSCDQLHRFLRSVCNLSISFALDTTLKRLVSSANFNTFEHTESSKSFIYFRNKRQMYYVCLGHLIITHNKNYNAYHSDPYASSKLSSSFFDRGVDVWNHLPSNIKFLTSLNSFKLAIKLFDLSAFLSLRFLINYVIRYYCSFYNVVSKFIDCC